MGHPHLNLPLKIHTKSIILAFKGLWIFEWEQICHPFSWRGISVPHQLTKGNEFLIYFSDLIVSSFFVLRFFSRC